MKTWQEFIETKMPHNGNVQSKYLLTDVECPQCHNLLYKNVEEPCMVSKKCKYMCLHHSCKFEEIV
jgi:hypothetical protein